MDYAAVQGSGQAPARGGSGSWQNQGPASDWDLLPSLSSFGSRMLESSGLFLEQGSSGCGHSDWKARGGEIWGKWKEISGARVLPDA